LCLALLGALEVTLALGGCVRHRAGNRNSDSVSDGSNNNAGLSKEDLAAAGLSPRPIEKTVVRESFLVGPVDYREFQLTAADRGRLDGKFSIDNGEDGKFNVLVLDDLNFEKLRHGGRIACYYESGPVSSGSLSVELTPNTYHIVFVNNEMQGPRISIGADIEFIVQ
jgi:hypothetical protein